MFADRYHRVGWVWGTHGVSSPGCQKRNETKSWRIISNVKHLPPPQILLCPHLEVPCREEQGALLANRLEKHVENAVRRESEVQVAD
jgi:hypothetical protein